MNLLKRLTTPAGSLLMVPMDHGISMGPLPGIVDIRPVLRAVAPYATCVTVHKGLVANAREAAPKLGQLMHLSASTDRAPDPNDKRLVGTVAEAKARGCHGVSTHLNLGSPTEATQIEAVGAVSTACYELGMAHVAMVYPRGPKIKNPFDAELVAHAARLGAELGADAVKVPYTGDVESFSDVVKGAGVPVIIAGGPARDDFMTAATGAREAGAAGVSVGRNVFQSSDPAATMKAIRDLFP